MKKITLTLFLLIYSFNSFSQSIDINFANNGFFRATTDQSFGGFQFSNDFSQLFFLSRVNREREISRVNLSDGTIDSSFGTNGKVFLTDDRDVSPVQLHVRSDNSFLVLSNEFKFVNSSIGSNWVIRLDDFSSTSRKNLNFGTGGTYTSNVSGNQDSNYGRTLHILNNGEILVPVNIDAFNPRENNRNVIRKLSKFGDNASTFSIDTNTSSSINSILINDKLYLNYSKFGPSRGVVREFNTNTNSSRQILSRNFSAVINSFFDINYFNNQVYLINEETTSISNIRRYNLDGTLDESFGVNKRIVFAPAFGGEFTIDESTGSIYICYTDPIDNTIINIERYLSNGILDDSFGNSGLFTIDLSDNVSIRGIKVHNNALLISGTNNGSFLLKVNVPGIPLSINDFSNNSSYLNFKNPVNDVINLNFKNSIPSSIALYDLNGKLVKEVKNVKPELKIDVSFLHKGIYLLKANDNEIKRLIIE